MDPAPIPPNAGTYGTDFLSYVDLLNGSSEPTVNLSSTFDSNAFEESINSEHIPVPTDIPAPTDIHVPTDIPIPIDIPAPTAIPIPTKVSAPKAKRNTAKRSKNFSIQEDNLLVSAWLNTTLDATVGNEQKSAAYWKRVWEYYQSEKDFESECDRNHSSLMHRWSGIQLDVNKFCGFYAEIERARPSGTTEQDRILEAKRMFREFRKSNFAYEHCWNILKLHPKWLLESSRKKAKTTHNASPGTSSPITLDSIESGDGNTESNESPSLERPMGKKAAKNLEKKAKSKEKAAEVECELKEYYKLKADLARKETEQFQLMFDAEQENIKLRKQEFDIQARKEDIAIMAIDTSTMEPKRAEYFEELQREIMKKRTGNKN